MNTKPKSPLKVALAGCGWFAQVAHLPALRQLELTGAIELVALFSRRQDSIQRAQQVIGRAVQGYTDYSALLANEDINAVDLVLPTPLMYPALRAAFQANKHVLSEKPCAASLAQCSELLQAYAGSQGKIAWGVAENWRFKPTVLRLVELVRPSSTVRRQKRGFLRATPRSHAGLRAAYGKAL
jgi:UDP-N-acetylglucosamine 3-dehydrogenase